MGAQVVEDQADDPDALQRVQARISQIQESVTKEAVLRAKAMHGKEEMWVLEAAIRAAQEGDTEKVTSLLCERLEKTKRVRRKAVRELASTAAWSSDDEEDAEKPSLQPHVDAEDTCQAGYWEELLGSPAGEFDKPESVHRRR